MSDVETVERFRLHEVTIRMPSLSIKTLKTPVMCHV